jgi:lipopolysaccharide transport system permease protein
VVSVASKHEAAERAVWRARSGWEPIDLRELWRYRELFWVLALRDLKVRYKQAALGTAWVVLQPLLTTGAFTFVFGSLGQMPSDGAPYAVFAYSAVLIYTLFARCLAAASTSLVGNQHLITKVYFPRLIYPLAPAVSSTIDFLVGAVVLALLMVWYGIAPHWTLLLTPAFALLAVACGVAIGLWLGALNVRYRDVGLLVPLLAQFWLYATPVVYPLSVVHERWPTLHLLFALNPMTGVVEGFRWAVLGVGQAPAGMIAGSSALIVLTVIGGLLYFRRTEDAFADMV